MVLEDIIRIKEQLNEELVTPMVLDYNIINNELYEKGYRGQMLEDMSLTRLKSLYIHNKQNGRL